jgi:hypothetical protein
MTDSFDAVLGTGRGSPARAAEPRFMDAPQSNSAALTSMADFTRRLRVGVRGTLDVLDEVGRVRDRLVGEVSALRGPRYPYFSVMLDGGRCAVARYPRRAGDCSLKGPSLTHRAKNSNGWRFTFLDESNAVALGDGETDERALTTPLRVSSDVISALDREVRAHFGSHYSAVRWRYFHTAEAPALVSGWTTERHWGKYWSFAATPVGPGARSARPGKVTLREDSPSGHQMRKDAKGRAQRLVDAANAGERAPWR